MAKFFTYFLLMSLMMLISETLGMLCAGLCRSELVGAIVLQGLYVPLLIFTGFFQARHAHLCTCQCSLIMLSGCYRASGPVCAPAHLHRLLPSALRMLHVTVR